MNNKKQIFEDVYSDNFKPNIIEKLIIRFEKNRSEVISSLLPQKSEVFLDLACGDGDLILKNHKKFSKLIGIDISNKRINNAKKKLKRISSKVKLISHDLDQGIPLLNESVNVIVCEASIAYLLRPEVFLSEVYRVLKKDGIFILQIGNYAFISRRVSLLLGRLPKISSFKGFGDGGMIHYFTFTSLKKLLNENNFKILVKTNSGIFSKLRMIWPSLLSSDIIYKSIKD